MESVKTLIIVSVRAPTIQGPEKMEAIRKVIFERVVEPLGFEKDIHYKEQHSIVDGNFLDFYLFRPGKLKRSLYERADKTLKKLKHDWLLMQGYAILTIGGKEIYQH